MDTTLVKTIKACVMQDMTINGDFSLDINHVTQCVKKLYLSKFKKSFDFKFATKRAVFVYISDMCSKLEKIHVKFDVEGIIVHCDLLKFKDRIVICDTQNKQAFGHLIEDKKARIHQILLGNFAAGLCELTKFSIAYINVDNFEIYELMYKFDQTLYDYILDKMTVLYSALNTQIVPTSDILEDYECDYCEHSDMCDTAYKKKLTANMVPIELSAITDDESIQETVRSAIKPDGHNYHPKEGEYRVSAVPSCGRRLYYSKLDGSIEQDTELNRMDIGKAFHHYIQKILPVTYLTNKEQEVMYVDDVITIIGHYDLRLAEIPEKSGDIKTANEYSFRWKVQSLDRYHYLQSNTYACICRTPKGGVLYVDITSFRLFEHEFDANEEDFKLIIKKLHLVEDCLKKKHIPDMSPANKNDCKYCAYKKIKCDGMY